MQTSTHTHALTHTHTPATAAAHKSGWQKRNIFYLTPRHPLTTLYELALCRLLLSFTALSSVSNCLGSAFELLLQIFPFYYFFTSCRVGAIYGFFFPLALSFRFSFHYFSGLFIFIYSFFFSLPTEKLKLQGMFGSFGGRFAPESLLHALEDLEHSYLNT